MHEVSLVAALIDQVNDAARQHRFEKISQIRLGVGGISGVDIDALLFCYPEITRGTILDHAVLNIEAIPAVLACNHCLEDSTPEDKWIMICNHCGSREVRVKSGREFKIIDLTVTDDGENN